MMWSVVLCLFFLGGINLLLIAEVTIVVVGPDGFSFNGLDLFALLFATGNVGPLDLGRDTDVFVVVRAMATCVSATVSSSFVEELCHD